DPRRTAHPRWRPPRTPPVSRLAETLRPAQPRRRHRVPPGGRSRQRGPTGRAGPQSCTGRTPDPQPAGPPHAYEDVAGGGRVEGDGHPGRGHQRTTIHNGRSTVDGVENPVRVAPNRLQLVHIGPAEGPLRAPEPAQ